MARAAPYTNQRAHLRSRGLRWCAAMAKFTALYELLGVPPGASAAVIKKAYRRLAVATHPDRCSAKDATERFQKLQVRRRGRAAGALGVLRGTLVGRLRGRAARGGSRGSQASLLEGKCGIC